MQKTLTYDYVIVGGGVAGVTAAEEIRTRDGAGSILIISKETEPLYSRVLLPHYVRGKIIRQKAFLRTLADYSRRTITLAPGEEVVSINIAAHTVLTSARHTIGFRKLLLATGGTPAEWSVEGARSPRVLRLQAIQDADYAHETLRELSNGARRRALIVGGGFIALEFIESAVAYGFPATVFTREGKFFEGALEDQGWEIVRQNFIQHNVDVRTQTEISVLQEQNGILKVTTMAGDVVEGSWLGLGIGIKKDFSFFAGLGLETGKKGIVTNEFLETSIPAIWAAGDATEFYDIVLDERHPSGNWTNAVLQGKVVGMNMAARTPQERKAFHAVSTYSITNLGFHLTFVGKSMPSEGMDDIIRSWPMSFEYERLFFKGGVLKGAVLINRFRDKMPIAKLIEEKVDIGAAKDSLRDPEFDIRVLLAKNN